MTTTEYITYKDLCEYCAARADKCLLTDTIRILASWGDTYEEATPDAIKQAETEATDEYIREYLIKAGILPEDDITPIERGQDSLEVWTARGYF